MTLKFEEEVTTNGGVREILPSHLFACDAVSCKNQAKRQPHTLSFSLHETRSACPLLLQ